MKKDEVTIGGTYAAKVGARTPAVWIEGENAKGGWNATAVDSGKPVRVKDARHLRPAPAAGQTVEPAEPDGGGEAAAGDGDGSAASAADAGKERRGKKGGTAKALREQASKPKAAKEQKPKRVGCLDAAAAVLKAQGEPMRCKEMVAEMKEKGLWTTNAPTPEATLYSAILREISAKKDDTRFKKTGRGHFALKD